MVVPTWVEGGATTLPLDTVTLFVALVPLPFDREGEEPSAPTGLLLLLVSDVGDLNCLPKGGSLFFLDDFGAPMGTDVIPFATGGGGRGGRGLTPPDDPLGTSPADAAELAWYGGAATLSTGGLAAGIRDMSMCKPSKTTTSSPILLAVLLLALL